MIFPGEKQYTSSSIFTYTAVIHIFEFNNEKHRIYSKFYLSDTEDGFFKEENVGKVLQGKYIVSQDERGRKFIFEILELTGERLKLKNLDNKSILDYRGMDIDQ
jgi:hypothetical protein